MNLFGRPYGILGSIGGRIMAATNKEINKWTVSLLDVQRNDRVLEVGFGPGIAAEEISNIIKEGLFVGIDPSEIMLSQAKRRNAAAIREGRVKLELASVEDLPMFDQRFNKIFSINSIVFWDQPIERLKDLRSRLMPGGQIAITLQPRSKGATEETTHQEGEKIVHYLKEAGFSQIRLETKKMKPVSAVCAIGVNSLS
jgi:ubiquinone/menaquinone biosynthesis C-methylase UbiE